MKNYEFALTGSSGQLLAYGQTQDIEDRGLQQVVQALCANVNNSLWISTQQSEEQPDMASDLPGGRTLYVAEADIHTCQTGR